jgi:hypothetical protein
MRGEKIVFELFILFLTFIYILVCLPYTPHLHTTAPHHITAPHHTTTSPHHQLQYKAIIKSGGKLRYHALSLFKVLYQYSPISTSLYFVSQYPSLVNYSLPTEGESESVQRSSFGVTTWHLFCLYY